MVSTVILSEAKISVFDVPVFNIKNKRDVDWAETKRDDLYPIDNQLVGLGQSKALADNWLHMGAKYLLQSSRQGRLF